MDGWQEQICILTSIEIYAQYWTVWKKNLDKNIKDVNIKKIKTNIIDNIDKYWDIPSILDCLEAKNIEDENII